MSAPAWPPPSRNAVVDSSGTAGACGGGAGVMGWQYPCPVIQSRNEASNARGLSVCSRLARMTRQRAKSASGRHRSGSGRRSRPASSPRGDPAHDGFADLSVSSNCTRRPVFRRGTVVRGRMRLPSSTSSTRSATRSQPRSLLWMARLNRARSRSRSAICSRGRMAQTSPSFGLIYSCSIVHRGSSGSPRPRLWRSRRRRFICFVRRLTGWP